MRLHGLLLFTALVISVTAQTGLQTPPPYVQREKGRPKNMKNCRLNARTIFPWIVGVWDVAYLNFVGMGSMITYIAFITTCRQYNAQHTAYKATAQFIWDFSHPDDPCMQEKVISAIYKHPHCVKSPKEATFFDFAVFRLRYPFDISGSAYPTALIPNSPLELMELARSFDHNPKTTGDCVLPQFKSQVEKPPRFKWDTFVQSVPFLSTCIQLLCEKDPSDLTFSNMCDKRFRERANSTMLCMRHRVGENITLGIRDAYWYAGSPLTCSGTTFGVAAQPKIRHNFKRPPVYDIHFVVTFLRVWPWLTKQRVNHSPAWKLITYIENTTSQHVSIPDPFTVLPPTKPYFVDDEQEKKREKTRQFLEHGDANEPTPSFKNLIFPLLSHFLFNQQ